MSNKTDALKENTKASFVKVDDNFLKLKKATEELKIDTAAGLGKANDNFEKLNENLTH